MFIPKNGGMMISLWVVAEQYIKLLNSPNPMYFTIRCFLVERVDYRPSEIKRKKSCLEFMLNIGKELNFYNRKGKNAETHGR